VEEFFRIMAVNMKRLGTPVHALSFYRALVEHFGRNAQVIIARHEGRPIAGMLTLRHRDEVCVPYASSLASHRHLFPIDAVYWEAIRLAWEEGAKRFGFGRSLEGSGPARYKGRWGAIGVPLHYEYLLLQRSEIPRYHQGNARMELARSVWSRLPLRLTTLLGPRLIRSIV
jgi:predicted N-acyltransferase